MKDRGRDERFRRDGTSFRRASRPGSAPSCFRGRRRRASTDADAGRVMAATEGTRLTLENEWIAAQWEAGPGLRLLRIDDRPPGRRDSSRRRGPFALSLAGRRADRRRRDAPAASPRVGPLSADPSATRSSERLPGREVAVSLSDAEGKLTVEWRAVLREGSHYIRQEVTVLAAGSDVAIQQIVLIDLEATGAAVRGSVKGSPVVAGNWFFGFEHPLSESTAGRRVRCALDRELPLPAGQAVSYSSVVGVARSGQMRRDFLAYVERERARPYGTFLHYNSWYDLGYFTPFDEAAALAVIETFGRELHEKRGVVLDSVLFDDGWDDHRLWGFNAGFPRGFAPLTEAAARYGSAPGVWLSPWGGYGKPRQERLQFGKDQSFESNEDGLALSGPVYYRRFREVCLDFVRRYGVNQFKFDGTGSSAKVFPGSAFGSDFEAAIALIGDLRAEKPGLFVNLTTGTYPSPWWLRYADAIWRGGRRPRLCGRRVGPPAVDHLPRRRHLPARRAGRPALPPQLAHAARPDLRPAREEARQRPGRRLRRGDPLLFRLRYAAPGNVRDARPPFGGQLVRPRRGGPLVAPATPRCSATRTGWEAIPRGSRSMAGAPGRPAGGS